MSLSGPLSIAPIRQVAYDVFTMKGILLAGGSGTRLEPLTRVTNKHLVAIYDEPMIMYPLKTLIRSGIRDILVISGREHTGHFLEFLGSGSEFGIDLTYRVQDEAGGIAHALLLAEQFVGRDNMTVILCDNIYEDTFPKAVRTFKKGARIFLKDVPDPERFGVATLARTNRVKKLVEKPKKPESNWAVTGLYQYDNRVFNMIRRLKPSARGELEITDVNNMYIRKGQMQAEFVNGFWSDAGTFPSLGRSVQWVMEQKEKTKK